MRKEDYISTLSFYFKPTSLRRHSIRKIVLCRDHLLSEFVASLKSHNLIFMLLAEFLRIK
jgi:hypothetical protein